MGAVEPIVVTGSTPVVLVAPHGGRRDWDRRPWGSAPLRVNDLHTAALARELAAASGAAAVINADLDRNDVDLNRVSDAHDRAPAFLELLAELVAAAIARHGRATVLTVHGWNVVQPAVDLGFGCAHDGALDGRAAVSPAFAAGAVPALMRACAARGIAATIGARYPARARENLVQLFAPRSRDDPRPLVHRLAALGAETDAMQLELGVPLRWPGSWRRRLVAACLEAMPALANGFGERARTVEPHPPAPRAAAARSTLEVASEGAGLLATIDVAGGRLLVFLPDGSLALFTGERTGGEEPERVAGLRLRRAPSGGVELAFAGPMMRFPDTSPFLDLERGLHGARPIERAEIALQLTPACAAPADSDFGAARGAVVLDGERFELTGHGFAGGGVPPAPWPRLRLAVAVGDSGRLSLAVGLPAGTPSGFLCRAGRHRPVTGASARLGPRNAPLDGLALDVELDGGERLGVTLEAVHRLPVVRGGAPQATRLLFASCRVRGVPGLAGWCELGGL